MPELNLNEEKLNELRERVKPYLTEARYQHTLSVEKEAAKLGELYLPEKTEKLRASALLHDITKRLNTEKQLQILEKCGIMADENMILSPSVFHAMTGAIIAAEDFAVFTDEEILSGIRWHTTGCDNMTRFECIVYLADYIEETRTFDDCVRLRRDFYDRIDAGDDPETVLDDIMIESFDLTVAGLLRDGVPIAPETVAARNSFIVKKRGLTDKSTMGGNQ